MNNKKTLYWAALLSSWLTLLLLPAVFAEESASKTAQSTPEQIVGVVLHHQSRKALGGSELVLLKNNEAVEQQTTKSNGEFSFSLAYEEGATYQLKVSHDSYLDQSIDLSLTLAKKRLPERIEIALAQEESFFNFQSNILDRETKEPVPNLRITLINTRSGEMSQLKSDYRGDYAFKVVSGYEYDLVFEQIYYLARYAHINYCSDVLEVNQKYCFSGFAQPRLNSANSGVSANVLVDKVAIGKKFAVKDIYYDYNKATLRKDALPSLRKLHHILKDNPQLVVELSSHTDARGSDGYNFKLSQQRADSVVDYLIGKDLSVYRMAAKGYGETALLNDCEDGVKCSDDAHAKNRRTEFVVIDIDEAAYVE